MSAIAELERRHEDATRQADRLGKMLDLARELGEDGLSELVSLLGVTDDRPANGNGHMKPDGPRGREAVRIIVRERPGIWTLSELRAEMTERGWFTSQKGLEAAVKRLCRINGEGRGLGGGRYVFPANHGEEDVIESNSSDGAMIPLRP
jgi:hypothetical protein